MNPTIAREITLGEKGKLRNEAKQIIKEVEAKAMQGCSFKPEINDYEAADEEITQEERWRRLLEPKTSKIQQLEKAKLERERKEIEAT